MVGRLNLSTVCNDDPLNMSDKAERILDSPDSGLPPSPSPSTWMLPVCGDKGAMSPVSEDEGRGSLVPIRPVGALNVHHLHPLSYGEGVELYPIPPTEIRYTSSVRYDSAHHFIQSLSWEPRGHALQRCSQTVMALAQSTWQHYRTQLDLQPRQRPCRYGSTTIVYPKQTHASYATELSCHGHRRPPAARYLSSVELEVGTRGMLWDGDNTGDGRCFPPRPPDKKL